MSTKTIIEKRAFMKWHRAHKRCQGVSPVKAIGNPRMMALHIKRGSHFQVKSGNDRIP